MTKAVRNMVVPLWRYIGAVRRYTPKGGYTACTGTTRTVIPVYTALPDDTPNGANPQTTRQPNLHQTPVANTMASGGRTAMRPMPRMDGSALVGDLSEQP